MDYLSELTRDPGTCGGETVFRGTRVLLRTVLADLADGASVEEILSDYPSLTPEHPPRWQDDDHGDACAVAPGSGGGTGVPPVPSGARGGRGQPRKKTAADGVQRPAKRPGRC